MLYPQNNKFRHMDDLSGFWDFEADEKDKGERAGWYKHGQAQMTWGKRRGFCLGSHTIIAGL